MGLAVAVIDAGSSPGLAARWLGGAMVGGGIAAMHYTGMAAFEVPGRMVWDPVLVAASIAARRPDRRRRVAGRTAPRFAEMEVVWARCC